jgi:ubiquinol-cytochrome c reductase cytochrome c1 subunit
MGCHSAQYQRYNRMARDLGLTDEQVLDNLIFTGVKIGETMKNAMPKDTAKKWFGAAPPDLSVIARSRGADYLYTYLRTFYLDESRPYGANNAIFPSVGMPHVLWELQGWQKAVYKTVKDASGNPMEVIDGFELVQEGSMPPREFDKAMADLVSFMVYIAEPIQQERKRIGVWVLLFLVLAFAVFYPLKKEYWKDVH